VVKQSDNNYIINKLKEHDKRFDAVDEQFNDIKTTLDLILKEMEGIREDRIFAIAKDRELDQKIDNLDKRVRILEGCTA